MPEYDPFNLPKPTAEERQQKHFLDSNEKRVGWVAKTLFLMRHLDGDGICLNSQCICEGFLKKRRTQDSHA